MLPGEAGETAWNALWHSASGIQVRGARLAGKPQQEAGWSWAVLLVNPHPLAFLSSGPAQEGAGMDPIPAREVLPSRSSVSLW